MQYYSHEFPGSLITSSNWPEKHLDSRAFHWPRSHLISLWLPWASISHFRLALAVKQAMVHLFFGLFFNGKNTFQEGKLHILTYVRVMCNLLKYKNERIPKKIVHLNLIRKLENIPRSILIYSLLILMCVYAYVCVCVCKRNTTNFIQADFNTLNINLNNNLESFQILCFK